MGQLEKVLFVVGARRTKKMWEKTGATATVALHRSNFTPAQGRCGPAKIIEQRCFKVRGGEGNLPIVWIFSLSLEARTMEEIHGE
jgi:hypothetical protein